MTTLPKKPIVALVGLTIALSSCMPYWWRGFQTGYAQPAYTQPPPATYTYADHILRPARDREKRELARLLYELRFISENLLPQASYYANPDARIRFDWHQLGRDLRHIEDGIESYLARGVPAPRSIPPITGDYGR